MIATAEYFTLKARQHEEKEFLEMKHELEMLILQKKEGQK